MAKLRLQVRKVTIGKLATLKRWQKISLSLVLLTASVLVYGIWYFYTRDAREPSRLAFQERCAACHGVDLRGKEAVPSLVGRALTYGEGHDELMGVISGHQDMPPMHDWREKLPAKLIKGIALYVSERRQGYVSTAASYKFAPKGTENQQSEHHTFAVEHVVTLRSRPYSLEIGRAHV